MIRIPVIHHLGSSFRTPLSLLVTLWLCGASGAVLAQQDLVEFLNGSRLTGTVTGIQVPAKQFEFESKIGQRTVKRTYQFAEVHAVTMRGKRHVLTEMPAPSKDGRVQRTEAEVRALIDAAAAEPSWFAQVKTNHPATLNLDWPEKPEGKWNNKKNMGQYIWDIINPNPSRWQSGVKLVHEITDTHRSQPALLKRDQQTLGRMYFELLRDYARAAYWFEQAKVTGREGPGVKLAECYWRLGNREMAMRTLTQPVLPLGAIKLLAELGEIDTALRLAKAYEGGRAENDARILAADALRIAGRLEEATKMYEKVLNSDTYRNDQYEARFKGRARDSLEAIRLFDKADVSQVADGTYRDESVGYNGALEVEVTVAAGKIADLKVTRHKEKQFYSALEDTPNQILQRQSVLDIDGFSGATITSGAIVNATAKALAKGSR